MTATASGRARGGLREASPGDAEAVAALAVRAWRAAYAGILPAAFLAGLDARAWAAEWRAYLEERPAEERLWLLCERRRLAGFARTGSCADDDVPAGAAELHGLYVEPKRTGRGLGSLLLRHAAADLAGRGFPLLVLWHFAANRRAGAFYERLGLRPDGARRPG